MAALKSYRTRRSPQRVAWEAFQRILIYLVLLSLGTAILLPFLWTLSSSLKPFGTGITFPPEFIPKRFEWQNYVKVFQTIPFFGYLRNSVVVTGLSMVGELVSCTLVAYAFARLRFPGSNVLFIVLLGTMMIPYPVTMVPTFILFNSLKWVNTYLPLVLPPFFAPAYNVFLLRQFFVTINRELDEAAEVDGASKFRIYWQIILPLAKPALATVAIFSFMYYWNDFMGPLIYLSDSKKFTLSLGINFLRSMRGGGDLSMQMAASIMFVSPCILLFFVAQRYIVEGIVTTGLKG
ncbi:MAG: carbohydrate ABC transporter permease [Anaerolineae bacterium]|nr:carbohydrate ABC transporter permease [Anaerolineae bacterium]